MCGLLFAPSQFILTNQRKKIINLSHQQLANGQNNRGSVWELLSVQQWHIAHLLREGAIEKLYTLEVLLQTYKIQPTAEKFLNLGDVYGVEAPMPHPDPLHKRRRLVDISLDN